jgi:hypothetical protein
MTRRHIHYEAAFEDYLRSRGVPYVPVDEAKRVIFGGEKVKSFDFLVYPGDERHWIVDVKGRQFPYISEQGARRYWENWVTKEDLEGLAEWETVFGRDFEARLVFAYLLEGPPDRWPAFRPHMFWGDSYAFYSVGLADYRARCRGRSSSWDTVAVSAKAFREIATPLSLASPRPV